MPPEDDKDKKPDGKAAGGAGDGTPPEDKAPEITFKTKGEFHAEVARKTKAEVTKATETLRQELLGKLGIESDEDIEAFKVRVEKAKTVVGETDGLKNAIEKANKKIKALEEGNQGLVGWKHSALKKEAVAKYAQRVADLELFQMYLEPKIVINDDDTVTGPHGKSLDDVVEDMLKAKPILKAPDFKPGAGTTPGGGKTAAPARKPEDAKPGSNGGGEAPKFATVGEAVKHALKAQRDAAEQP